MTEPIILTDATLNETLNGDKPVLLLLSNGEGLRGEFITAFNKAAQENADIVVAKIDPTANPEATERFNVRRKPVMVGWSDGEAIIRRSRPWGTDVPLAVNVLKEKLAEKQPPSDGEAADASQTNQSTEEKTIVYNEPVHVTDNTFEDEVLNAELPVLIDFWAEWCGPCKMVAPILDKLAGEFAGQVKIAKVDVDNNPGLAQSFQIMSIPNMMAIKEKTIVFNQPGALPEEALRDLIQQLIALEIPPREEQEEENSTEASGD